MMTVKECKKYYNAVVSGGIEWAHGNGEICNLDELRILADKFNLPMKSYCYHFVYSDNPNRVSATRAHKSLLFWLNRLQSNILSSIGEDNT